MKLNNSVLISLSFIALALHMEGALAVAPPVDAGDANTQSGGKESAEVVEQARETVFSQREAAIAQGEKRFNQTCVYCHGNRGAGGKARKLQGREFEPDYLFKTISNGKRRGSLVMPPWKRSFTVEERWELVTYILSLSNEL